MKFKCENPQCGDFNVTKQQGQGYAENKICYFRTEYVSKEKFQNELNNMCIKCMVGMLSLRNV